MVEKPARRGKHRAGVMQAVARQRAIKSAAIIHKAAAAKVETAKTLAPISL